MTMQADRGKISKQEREFNERLAQTIRNYWKERGRDVKTRIVSDGHTPAYRAAVGSIRSDL